MPELTPEIQRKLDDYDTLLKKWQRQINLVANSTLNDTKNRHFQDSVQILPMITADSRSLYDLGSGGGFPGLVIAICRPDINVSLIESNTKKTNFLSTVARELQLDNVTIHTRRIEDMAKELPAPDVITARALASLREIFDLTKPWAHSNYELRYVLMKGKTARDEIADALQTYRFAHYSAPSSTDREAAILRIETVLPK